MSDARTTADDAADWAARAASFGPEAKLYHRARPGYPREAARYLTEASPCDVLELGAGTGKLTAELTALGHRVVATDPSRDMLKQLRKVAPDAHAAVGKAERIPLPRASVDVVVAAQCFHWFDHDEALREIARVLRPGGVLSLVWNSPDFKVPWVRRLFALTGQRASDTDDTTDPVEESEVFDLADTRDFRHWQLLHRTSVQEYVATTSYVSTQSDTDREKTLAAAGEIYDDYGRGPDGMLLPWHAWCFRCRVSVDHDQATRARKQPPRPTTSGDTDDLLIDFL